MNQKNKGIIFDLDDTLCDWSAAQINTKIKITPLLIKNQINADVFWNDFDTINPLIYQQFVNCSISKEDYRIKRFSDPLKNQNVFDDDLCFEINEIFVNYANSSVILLPGTKTILDEIKKAGYRMALLTNGPSDGQREKLKVLKLDKFFDAVCISEEIKTGKPNPDAFKFACNAISISHYSAIMVGDSMKLDINPAISLGMKAFLIGKKSIPVKSMSQQPIPCGDIYDLLKWIRR